MWAEALALLKEYGAFGLMALMVGFGWLIPRWTHRERVNDLKQQIVKQDKTIETLLAQRDELMEFGRTTVAAFQVLPKANTREPL